MLKSVNKVIKVFIISDFFFQYAWGLLGPVFAIFIVQNIVSSPAEAAKVAGFAALFYWVVKSLLQIPIGSYLDKNHGEKDDFWFIVIGTFITGLVPFGYLFSSYPWHIYVLYALHAIGAAMMIPAWSAVFTRHIDKGKEAFELATRSTSLGFAAGISGAIGGVMVALLGFKIVFILVGVITIFSGFILFLIYKDISPKDHISPWSFFTRPPFKNL
jgi:MFS family permease